MMKHLRILFCSYLLFQYAQAENLVFQIRLTKAKEGTAYLYNHNKQIVDTIRYSNHTLNFFKDLKEPALWQLTFEGVNGLDRPMWFLLSNETTEITLDSLIKPNETKEGFKPLPNEPVFIKDPNQNYIFYNFKYDWLRFYKAIETEAEFSKREKLYNNFVASTTKIIIENKKSLIGALILDHLTRDRLLSIEETQALADSLNHDYHNYKIYDFIKSQIGFASGSPAPDFDITASNGMRFKLKEQFGKKVLLHFWNSGCVPCMEEVPELVNLLNERKNKQIVFLNISRDKDKTKWLNAIKKSKVEKFNNYCDFKANESQIFIDYKITSYPSYYLVDEFGKIIIKKSSLMGISPYL